MTKIRTAKISDFKVGATLITSEGYEFILEDLYQGIGGIWNARGTQGQGGKVLFESEARHYKIKAESNDFVTLISEEGIPFAVSLEDLEEAAIKHSEKIQKWKEDSIALSWNIPPVRNEMGS